MVGKQWPHWVMGGGAEKKVFAYGWTGVNFLNNFSS